MPNYYKDEKGHWTTKENDGGPCNHDEDFDNDYEFDEWPEGDMPEGDKPVDSKDLIEENHNISKEEEESIQKDSKLNALKERLNNHYISIETDALRKLSDKDIDDLNSKLDELEEIINRGK